MELSIMELSNNVSLLYEYERSHMWFSKQPNSAILYSLKLTVINKVFLTHTKIRKYERKRQLIMKYGVL